ncbi:hypothetical protein JG687_00001136 [Phytophthora cactorum]|uniref:PD-(D/E)XK endonuclease-like domain-containing protein n=1 Tax=Phytophthora cactorum TaxID=29920 RepID=A0A8T1V0N6_9STRA|nr:hypothetical protein JG687_00001136 [Phytophthora cactorum]
MKYGLTCFASVALTNVQDKKCYGLLRDVLQCPNADGNAAQVVGLVADQRCNSEHTRANVRFLGQPTYFATGAARLHMETGESLWFAAVLHNKHYYESSDPSEKPFRLVLRPISMNATTAQENATEIVQTYASMLEKLVLEYPEQYLWMHDLWNTKQRGTLYVARRSLERTVLLHQAWPSSVHNCRLFSSVSSINASNSDVSVLPGSPSIVHQSLVTSVPNLQALQRVRWLLQQPQRRVLLLMGNSASDSPVRAALERDSPAFELERRGHGIFGVHEFCQLLLRESSRERRIFGRAQLAALLLHNGLALPGASGLAATSTLQRRKGIQDLLQLFRLLEREGATPEQYAAVAVASGEQAPQELAETYSKYMELLIQNNATSWDGLVMDVLELCGVQKGNAAVQEATAKEFSQAVLKEYTDVVVDDVQRMTPAMATLVGHLCGQPSVKSSASFSRVLLDGDECPQTQILEQQILKTARYYFAFPAELLSWLMEKEHRSHVDLFPVLEAFVKSQGKSLGTSLNYRGGEELELPQPASSQLESGLEIAESFVNIIKRLRAESHQLSAAEIVQSFLEDIGRLDALLSPSSPEQERESLVLADFLRELETAQNVVKSDHVTFVAPYLQQLRETNLTSSVSLEDAPEVLSTNSTARDTGIQVLPLTTYALESLASSVSDGEYDRLHVLVLMSMRDSKFPGRMKRLTLPLPYELLSEPYPVQTRTEHLEQCEQLAYQALTLGDYSEVVLSFAELAPTSSSKRETLSRTFQPIWHEGDRPAATNGKGSSKGRTGTSAATSSPKLSSLKRSSTNGAVLNEEAAPVKVTSHFWLSGVAGLLREFVNRVFLPILHLKNRLAAADASPITTREDDNAAYSRQKQDAVNVKQPTAAIPTETETSTATSISEYLRCPHRYYLGRVMKLDGDVSTAMMFGRALHEGVAVFAKSLAATQLNGEVTQETKTLAAVEAKEAFMCAWVGDGYGLFTSKEQASFLLERGMMALWEFIETHYGDLQLEEIVHVEKEFSFHVPEANVELRGVWDRIDRVSSPIGDGSSSFVIKEFKSNLGGAERNMRKLADDSLQLKMYMYAFHKVFGEAPYGAKLQQIGGNYNEPSSDATKARRRRISRAGNDDNGFVHFSEEAAQEAKDAIVEGLPVIFPPMMHPMNVNQQEESALQPRDNEDYQLKW